MWRGGSEAREAPSTRPPCPRAPSVRPGAGAGGGRGWRILGNGSGASVREASRTPTPGVWPAPRGPEREAAPPRVGGLDSNPQQTSRAPEPKQVHQSVRERAAPGVPSRVQPQQESPARTQQMFPGCWGRRGTGPGPFPGLPQSPVQIRILIPQRPGAHSGRIPSTSGAWWGLCPHPLGEEPPRHPASPQTALSVDPWPGPLRLFLDRVG